MRKFTWTYFLISLILLIGGISIKVRQNYEMKHVIDVKRFERVLYSKESYVDDWLNRFEQKIKFHYYEQKNGIYFFDTLDLTGFDTRDIYWAVYRLDTLVFWTSNQLDIPLVESNTLGLYVNKFGNTWYEIRSKKFGIYSVYGFIKLKDEYPYTNRYLHNHFAKGFALPGSLSISMIPVSFGYNIKSKEGNYLFSLVPVNPIKKPLTKSLDLSFIFILSWYLFLLGLYHSLENTRGLGTEFFVLFVLFLVRSGMLFFRVPSGLYELPMFSKEILGYSLGDFLIDIGLAVFIVRIFYKKLIYGEIRPKGRGNKFDFWFLVLADTVSATLMYLLFDWFYEFAFYSGLNFEVFNIVNLDLCSIVALLAFGFAFGIVIFLFVEWNKVVSGYLPRYILWIVGIVSFLVIGILDVSLGTVHLWLKIAIIFVILLGLILLNRLNVKNGYLFLFAIFISAFIMTGGVIMSHERIMFARAKRVVGEIEHIRDAVAEQLLFDIDKQLRQDNILNAYLTTKMTGKIESRLTHYLYKEYFQGYWKKYEINVVVCSNYLTGKNQYQVCTNRMEQVLTRNGQKLGKDLYLVNMPDGTIMYVIKLSSSQVNLYINLRPKIGYHKVGYPELLLDNSDKKWELPKYFSYAKYYNNKLVARKGSFDYPLVLPEQFKVSKDTVLVDYLGFKHLVVRHITGKNVRYIVLSYRKIRLFDIIITFAYLFVVYIVLAFITLMMLNFEQLIRIPHFSIRAKFTIAMIGILTIAFLALGMVTVIFNVNKYKSKFYQQILNKLHSATDAIELTMNTASDTSNNVSELNLELRTIADIIGGDINVYDSHGILRGTSREKIFKSHLLSRLMSYKALYSLIIKQRRSFVTKEYIGDLGYTSAYSILLSPHNKVMGFVDIPFFVNPGLLHEEISNLLVTLINLYVLLFLITLFIAILMSEQVISPLNILQQKLKMLEVGQRYEKIEYKRKDEIGLLVDEYNKMVDKLQESVNYLAKNERESAWREMAKQIAHEIKNPLTPMKLSIQLLQRAWENNDKNFGKRLKDVTQTLIEQIETLKNIAEEFSAFAKLPPPENEKIDLAQKIENIVKLYENTENVEIKTVIKARPVYVWTDNKQLSRVFINLIKNAIQAIPEGVHGKVEIELDKTDEKAIVKIKDNGTGIPEEIRDKLFLPSFTTKSSGMGLGLAMVKNIIQNANGRIWFETEVGKGTTFFIEFPLYKEKEDETES